MRKLFFLLTILYFGLSLAQNHLWNFQTTSTISLSQHTINLSDTDSQGNIYVAGKYGRFAFPSVNSISFDGITKTTSANETSRAILAKLDKKTLSHKVCKLKS
jgi:hypothetical protein